MGSLGTLLCIFVGILGGYLAGYHAASGDFNKVLEEERKKKEFRDDA